MELATKALATEDGQSAQTTQLQAISTAIGNIGLNNIGNLATLTTTDKTSLVGAVNEVNAGLVAKADETEVAAIENVYGSKNLMPNNATTQTINGVTFTINADKSVTVNGTATNWAVLMLTTSVFNAGTYRIVDVLDTEPYIVVRENNGSGTILCSSDTGYEFTLTTSKTLWVAIAVRPNTTVNKTIYPMIRDARISDSTYVPYAMTNRELTETVTSLEPTVGKSIKATNSAWSGTTLTFSNITAVNNVMYRFTALRNDGGYCEYILINRADGIKSGKIAGNVDCTFTINGTTLTVTFASTGYWCYQLVKLNNYN